MTEKRPESLSREMQTHKDMAQKLRASVLGLTQSVQAETGHPGRILAAISGGPDSRDDAHAP